jgi:di/tricarboxylate transporter
VTTADLSIIVLVALFAATALRSFNLGLAALPAAFLVGLVAGVPAEEVTAFFPSDFFVLIVGVTALFAVAQINGTLDWLLGWMLRLVGGRVALAALVPFLIGAVLTAVGTLPAAATAIVAPIALGLARRNGTSPFVAALLGITGIISGLLSPLAVYGVTAGQLGERFGIALPDSTPVTLLAGGLLCGVVVAAVALAIGVRTGAVPAEPVQAGSAEPVQGEPAEPVQPAPGGTVLATRPVTDAGPATGTGARVLTLACLAAVVVLAVGFDVNIGYLGLTAAVVQQLVLRLDPGQILERIPWNIVLLIGGLLTYIGLMQELGAFARISDLLSVDGSPALSLLVLCYVVGVTSFAASSIAVFTTAVPLIPPLVEAGVNPVGAVLAVALASVLVDVNPLGITGGLILGAAEPDARPKLFRQLLVYGLVSIVVAPLVAWAAFSWW